MVHLQDKLDGATPKTITCFSILVLNPNKATAFGFKIGPYIYFNMNVSNPVITSNVKLFLIISNSQNFLCSMQKSTAKLIPLFTPLLVFPVIFLIVSIDS